MAADDGDPGCADGSSGAVEEVGWHTFYTD
jgi:hypothetical protein